MKIETLLRLENTQEDNTWFSRANVDPNIQLHCDREVWVALGKPNDIKITIEPLPKGYIDVAGG